MAEIAYRRELSLPSARLALDWLIEHRELVALGSIMLIAALLRFWGLDAKALHHDESLHAQFTWYLYEGRGYQHDPLMHGPFLFHSGAAIFFLFGDSDYTIRVLPALFGTVLVGMPYLLRKQIGMPAVLIAAVLLTLSPSLLYVSRFYRDDIYIDVWTLGMVICVWRYLDEQRDVFLYALAALLALSFATMEITFITAAIMLVFLDLMLAIELGKRRDDEDQLSGLEIGLRTLALVPIAWLVAAVWPLLRPGHFGREQLPPVGAVIIVLGTLTLPQFSAGIEMVPASVGQHLASILDAVPLIGHDLAELPRRLLMGNLGYKNPEENSMRNVTVFSLLLLSAYAGLIWRPRVWLIAATAFYLPYVLLYTTFLTNMPGFFSGIWGSLDYWLAQHDVQRGAQPLYYYGLMTPLYEYLPLVLAIGGAGWLLLRGDSLKRWLVFWLLGIFVGLSIAGEKMPWLEVHIALPLVLVASLALAGAIKALDLRDERWRAVAIGGSVAAADALLLVESTGALRVAGWLIAAALVAWVVAALVRQGRGAMGRAALSVGVAALLALTARTAIIASFEHDDTPVEMLVYTQTSPDIPRLVDRIDALAKASGMGYNLPIVVDPSDGFSWPWAWYLRNYHDVSYAPPNAGVPPPAGAVLLISQSNSGKIDSTAYSVTPYRHRWWFCESYRDPTGACLVSGGMTPGQIVSKLTDSSTLKSLAHFFLYRRSESKTSAVEAAAYFPASLSAYDVGAPPPRAASAPVREADGRLTIGGGGSARGQFLQPAGLWVDAQGDIWVADGLNNRIQKFDAEGNYLTGLGAGVAGLNEPWSVAVDAQGFVYVADTWNHRIQKFSPDLKLITTWGKPVVNLANPGLLELFGPRDIAIDRDGSLWVTDTGDKRLLHYSANGEPLGAFGSAGNALGQFDEPVGIALDATGRLYVADAWNGRIQRFDPGFTSPVSFPTGWSSRDLLAKPYLAVLTDGRIVATDPAQARLLLLGTDGRLMGTWKVSADGLPAGIAAMPDGGFVYSDVRYHQIQVVPAGLIGTLFK